MATAVRVVMGLRWMGTMWAVPEGVRCVRVGVIPVGSEDGVVFAGGERSVLESDGITCEVEKERRIEGPA